MPDAMEVKTPKEYMRLLVESGILRADELRVARGMSRETSTAKMLARRLVAKGILTRWQAGQLLAGWTKLRLGQHKLCRQVGRSEFGRVFLAEHIQLRREVAIKTLSRRYTQTAEIVDRFLEEARSAAALDHHNLAHVLDIDSADGQYYVVMEYVVGQDLQRLVEDSEPLQPGRAVGYLCQVADGLQYAHQAGLMHQDVCPANIMLDEKGVIKILSLGVGPLRGLGRRSEHSADDAASDLGGDYRAPERAADDQPGDVFGDIYSLGCTAGYLLTGRSPGGKSEHVAADPRVDEVAYHEELMRHDLPADLVVILQRMTAIEPTQRFASAQAVGVALREWLEKNTDGVPAVGRGDVGSSDPSIPPPGPDPFAVVVDAAESSKSAKAVAGSKVTAATPRDWRPVLAVASAVACVLIAAVCYVFWPRSSTPVALQNSHVEWPRESQQPEQPKPRRKTGLRRRHPQENTNKTSFPKARVGHASNVSDDDASAESMPAAAGTPATPAENASAKVVPTAAEAEKSDSKTPNPKVPAQPNPKKLPPTKPAAKKTPTVPPLVAGNPLRDLPDVVDLPTLESTDVVCDIGPLKASVARRLKVTLLGGEHAAGRTGRFSLQADRRPATSAWTILLQGALVQGAVLQEAVLQEERGAVDANEPLPVAHVAVVGETLRFSWDANAAAQVLAGHLCNCVLRFSIEQHVHDLRLRTVKQVEPLIVNLKKPSISQRFSIPAVPDPRHVRFEITQLDDPFPSTYNLKPVAPIVADGDLVTVQIGSDDIKDHVLFLELVPRLRTTFRVECKVMFQISPRLEPALLTHKKFEMAAGFVAKKQNLDNLKAQQARAALARVPRWDGKRKAVQQKNVRRLEAQLEETSKATTRVEVLREMRQAMADGAALHFRLYYLADGCEVDLVRTTVP